MEKKTKKRMLELGIFIFLVSGFLIMSNKQDKETKAIFKNAKYVPGEIIFYSGGSGTTVVPGIVNNPGQSEWVKFKYKVDGKEYINTESDIEPKIPKEGVKVGDKFVIVYHKDDPEKVRVIFDRPIKNEKDFKKHQKELE